MTIEQTSIPPSKDAHAQTTRPRGTERRGTSGVDYKGRERRSGVDRRENHAAYQKARVRRARLMFFERMMMTGAIVFIVLTLLGVFLMLPEYKIMSGRAQQVDTLQAELDATRVQMQRLQAERDAAAKSAAVPKSSIGGRINSGIEAAENMGAAAVDRLRTLETDMAAVNKSVDSVIGMLQKAETMQGSAVGQVEYQESIAALRGAIDGLGGDISKLGSAVNEARQENKALADVMQGVGARDVGAAALLLSLNQLRQNAGNDNKPLADDIELLKTLTQDDPEMSAALDRLTPYAESGVLSTATLSQEFKSLASDIALAKIRGEDASVSDRARDRLNELVKIRKTDETAAGNAAAVARAQAALDRGDVKTAMQELQALDPAAQQVAAPWMQQAQGRVAADEGVNAIMSELVHKLQSGQGIVDVLNGVTGRSGTAPIVSPQR